MKRLIPALAAACLVLAAIAPSMLATTTKMPTWGEEHVLSGVGSVPPTTIGTLMFVRDEHHTAEITGSGPGSQESWVNWDLDLVTGGGRLWGTTQLALTGLPAGFDCTFEGTIPAGSWFTTWTAHSVCRGTGLFEGYQSRSDAVAAPFGSTFTGYYFSPADKG